MLVLGRVPFSFVKGTTLLKNYRKVVRKLAVLNVPIVQRKYR